jgi:hypothetical protein
MDRRDFIRIVTSVYTSNTLLMTLTTSAKSEKLVMQGDEAQIVQADESETPQSPAHADTEKVDVSNRGKNLVLDISGKPGRFVVILYRLQDKKAIIHNFIHKITRIRKPGIVSVAVDLADALDMDIPFMVVTSSTIKFNKDNRGTNWFTIRINSTQPVSSNLPQNYATDPDGEHQKVVMYGVVSILKRSFAPLKRL